MAGSAAGRARWPAITQGGLAEAAGVGLAVVVHAEVVDRRPTLSGSTAAIRAALEERGITLL